MFFFNIMYKLLSFKLLLSYFILKFIILKPFNWLLFLFDYFFFILYKLVFLYNYNIKDIRSNKMNMVLFIKNYSFFFNIKQLYKIDNWINYLIKRNNHIYTVTFLKNIFTFIKTLFFKLYSLIFVKLYNLNPLYNLTKIVLPIFDSNISVLLNKKISFFYLFFSNNTFFSYKYYYFSMFIPGISKLKYVFKNSDKDSFNIKYFISNSSSVKQFKLVNDVTHTFKHKLLYIKHIFVYNSLFNNNRNNLFFKLLKYKLKDCLILYLNKLNTGQLINMSKLLYNINNKYLITNSLNTFNNIEFRNSIDRYIFVNILEYLLEYKIYYFLKNKHVFKLLFRKWIFYLTTLFYTKLLTFKRTLLFFYYLNSKKTDTQMFKYITLTHNINYHKVVLDNKITGITYKYLEPAYNSIHNINTFVLLKDKELKDKVVFAYKKQKPKKNKIYRYGFLRYYPGILDCLNISRK